MSPLLTLVMTLLSRFLLKRKSTSVAVKNVQGANSSVVDADSWHGIASNPFTEQSSAEPVGTHCDGLAVGQAAGVRVRA